MVDSNKYVPVDFSTASVMSTSDSSADVTVTMEGFMSDSINPIFPTALVKENKFRL